MPANWQASHLPGAEGFAKLVWPLASKLYSQPLKVGDPLKVGQLIVRMLHPLNAICSLVLTTVKTSSSASNVPHSQFNPVIQNSEHGSTLLQTLLWLPTALRIKSRYPAAAYSTVHSSGLTFDFSLKLLLVSKSTEICSLS